MSKSMQESGPSQEPSKKLTRKEKKAARAEAWRDRQQPPRLALPGRRAEPVPQSPSGESAAERAARLAALTEKANLQPAAEPARQRGGRLQPLPPLSAAAGEQAGADAAQHATPPPSGNAEPAAHTPAAARLVPAEPDIPRKSPWEHEDGPAALDPGFALAGPAEALISPELGQRRDTQHIGSAESRGDRDDMEDRYRVIVPFNGKEDSFFVGVYGGNNGPEAAAEVAQLLDKIVQAEIGKGFLPHIALRNAYRIIDPSISHERSGTTAVNAIRQGNMLYLANVGDCMAVLNRGGQANELSIRHSLQDKEERKRAIERGAKVVRDKNKRYHIEENEGLEVSRGIGNRHVGPAIAPNGAINEVEIGKHDRQLILASNGLWNVLGPKEAVRLINNIDNPEKASARLTDYAIKKYREQGLPVDSIQVVVVNLTHNPAILREPSPHQPSPHTKEPKPRPWWNPWGNKETLDENDSPAEEPVIAHGRAQVSSKGVASIPLNDFQNN